MHPAAGRAARSPATQGSAGGCQPECAAHGPCQATYRPGFQDPGHSCPCQCSCPQEPVTAHCLSPDPAPPRWRTRILVPRGAELLLTFLSKVPVPVRAGECVTRPLEGMLLGLRRDKATPKLLATRAPAHTALAGPYSPSTEPSPGLFYLLFPWVLP